MTSSRSTRGRAPALQVKTQPLNARTLGYWRDRLPVPAYDRDLVTAGGGPPGPGGCPPGAPGGDPPPAPNEGAARAWGGPAAPAEGGRPGEERRPSRPGG